MRWLNVITLNGHLFEQTHRDSEGQRKPACCSSQGCRVGHNLVTEKQQQQNSQLTNSVVMLSGEQGRDSDIHIQVSILPQIPLPSKLPHNIEQSSLCYAMHPCWLSILHSFLGSKTKHVVKHQKITASHKMKKKKSQINSDFSDVHLNSVRPVPHFSPP